MGEITLARVDDRLIHGQVIVKWLRSAHGDTIVIIDDILANDKYMRDIYKMATPPGVDVETMSAKTAYEEWQKGTFKQKMVLVLFKDVSTAREAIKGGLPIKSLNIGGIGKKQGVNSKQILGSISLEERDARILLDLKETWNTEIYFQVIPEQTRLKFSSVFLKKYFPSL